MLSRLLLKNHMKVHKLVIVRHGESVWSKEKKWAGWADVPLSPEGISQAKESAKQIKHAQLDFDEVYTSVLTRAIRTTNYILDELDAHYLPVQKDWRLNEKHYGSLQGESKVEMAEKYGQDEVEVWRRSFDVPPPKLDVHDSRHPSFDPRYKHIDPELLPTSESLSDLVGRIKPLWEQSIKPKIQENKKILIVAHGSSIRALIYLLDHINSEDIKNVDIPNGTPIIYTLNTDLTPITHEYLGDESEIQNRMDRIKNETKTIEVE